MQIQSFQCNIPIPDLKISIETKSDEQNKRFVILCSKVSIEAILFFFVKQMWRHQKCENQKSIA